jgi:hypothetical protein
MHVTKPSFTDVLYYSFLECHLTFVKPRFTDVDMIWYRNPLDYFHDPKSPDSEFDMYYQDDGNHAIYYSPYSANTGCTYSILPRMLVLPMYPHFASLTLELQFIMFATMTRHGIFSTVYSWRVT